MLSARFLRSISKIQRPEEASRFLRLDLYWQPEVVERLLARVDEIIPRKPKNALGLAEIALEMTRRMRNPRRELRAHAHCSLADAQRWLGRLAACGTNLHNAEKLAVDGPYSLRAMVQRQKALYLIELKDLDSALKVAKAAVALERSNEAPPIKSLLVEGIVYGFLEEPEKSCACFDEARKLADPNSTDYIFATNNLVASLMKGPLLGTEIVQARKLLRQILDQIRGVRQSPVRYMIWYTEGLLHAIMEEYRQAAAHFLQAREGFLRLEAIPDYARVSVDHIDVLVKKGDEERARITLERTAKNVGEFQGNERLAEIFRSAQELPIAESAGFLRSRLSQALEEVGSKAQLSASSSTA